MEDKKVKYYRKYRAINKKDELIDTNFHFRTIMNLKESNYELFDWIVRVTKWKGDRALPLDYPELYKPAPLLNKIVIFIKIHNNNIAIDDIVKHMSYDKETKEIDENIKKDTEKSIKILIKNKVLHKENKCVNVTGVKVGVQFIFKKNKNR